MERLRGRDEIVREWGAYSPTRVWLISIKHAFVQIVGAVRVCLYRCCSRMRDTVRNMPPLAFGVPMNNTVNISL